MTRCCHRCGCIEPDQRWSVNEDGMDQCESCHRYLATARSILAAMRDATSVMTARPTMVYLQARVSWQEPETVRAVFSSLICQHILEVTNDLRIVCPRGAFVE